MRYRDIMEAPLAGVEHHGDWSSDEHVNKPFRAGDPDGYQEIKRTGNSFLSRQDRRLVRDPATVAKLETTFARFDTRFYVYFFNAPEMAFFLNNIDHGEFRMDDSYALANFPAPFVHKIMGRRDSQTIQFILTNNDGGDVRHRLTPWMIVHRMVHGLIGEGGMDKADAWVSEAKKLAGVIYGIGEGLLEKSDATEMLLKAICTFRAAREDNILHDLPLELVVEMMVQWIVTGKLVLKEAPETLLFAREFHIMGRMEYEPKKATRIPSHAKAVSAFETRMVREFQKTLQDAKGRIFIT